MFSKPSRRIAVIGGSGFIGRHLAPKLVEAGHEVVVLSRKRPEAIPWRTFLPAEVRTVDVADREALTKALASFDTVVNLIGILSESHHDTFKSAHFQTVSNLVRCAQENGIHRFIQLSALGASASRGPSRYLRSKGEADQYLHTYFRNKGGITVFRPSVVFGHGDGFVCRMARLLPWMVPRLLPLFPLPRARARLAPVFVGDLAGMIVDSLDNPEYFGKDVDVCGPHTYMLGDLMRLIAHAVGKRPIIIEVPHWLGRIQSGVLGMLPGQLMTTDQFDSLAIDNVAIGARRGKTHLASVLPSLVSSIRCEDPFCTKRATARRP